MIRKFTFIFAGFLIYCTGYSQLKTVKIEINSSDKQILENDPFDSEDVPGNFVGGDDLRRDDIELNYRGAYALNSLIRSNRRQRNWKVKLEKEERYRDRREWNYNYEPHARQELAYYLMDKAGVPVPSCRRVLLSVNDEVMGLYSEYEDPDNKRWLTDHFDNNDGDLYKAAVDQPFKKRFFAGLDDLGDESADYFSHYNKKTNHKNDNEGDYQSIVDFIKIINNTSDEKFVETIQKHFETETFIKYLVVANFISNWDSYPVRPKNFWLYNNPDTQKWTFIPWDLDATFQTELSHINQMGPRASVFYQFDRFEFYNLQTSEGTARPLARRMMKFQIYRDAYVLEYRRALESYLKEDMLIMVLDSMKNVVEDSNLGSEFNRYVGSDNNIRQFISERITVVTEELGADTTEVVITGRYDIEKNENLIKVYPNPVRDKVTVNFNLKNADRVRILLLGVRGETLRIINAKNYVSGNHKIDVDTKDLSPGLYFISMETTVKKISKKLIVE